MLMNGAVQIEKNVTTKTITGRNPHIPFTEQGLLFILVLEAEGAVGGDGILGKSGCQVQALLLHMLPLACNHTKGLGFRVR